ncbi:MAG: hypothetical protein V3W34_12660 [Phycisphaerae bacterium]
MIRSGEPPDDHRVPHPVIRPTSHHILVVDEERALREELADFFHSEGFRCSRARNATEALELAGARDFATRRPGITGQSPAPA